MEVINLNIIPGKAQPVVHASQYDVGRVIRCNLFEGAEVFYLDGTETISCNIKKPDNNIVTLSVTNTNDSYVEITTTEQATACDGSNLCEISITKGDDVIGSLNFSMEVERSPIEGGISSASEINNLWTQVDGMVADALATQYDSANVVFDNLPTEGHGIPYTVTSEGIGNAIDDALDMTDTASGAIATFESEYALPLRDLEIEINAVQESGTPTPSSPKAISGFTGANVVNCSDNLVTGMTTSTADGITTSYDNTTGLISIENNSRTTNYATGSSRNAVASNLDTSHTYKYKFIPEITGVIATDAAGVGLPLNEEFTGVASVKLRVTSAYDFVSTHPIGDITTTRLVIVDVTEGGKITTYPVSWNDEAGTVYGGSLDVTSGKLTVTHGFKTYTGASGENWQFELAAGGTQKNFYIAISDSKRPQTAQNSTMKCNLSPISNTSSAVQDTCFISNGRNFNFTWGNTLNISSATDFKTWLGSNNLQVCYELETPVTYQLTPTQISAIVGTNNVFTDTNGNTSLEYYTKRGEQTVRIAEGVAVDVIQNKSIDTLNTTDKTVKGAINELETNKANGWAFVNETLGNTDINLPTGWSEILVVCRYGNGGVLQPQAVSIVITPEQKGLYMTAGASTILAQVVVSADTTKVNMTYFGVSGTEYTSDSQIRVWYR